MGTDISTGVAMALEISDLHVSLGGAAVLEGVDLAVKPSEVLALLGPSGCGKTTLLRSVAGFVAPHRGSIGIHGATVAAQGVWTHPEDRNVGLVPQDGALFPHLDVAGNVGFGLDALGRHRRAARVGECLELVGLGGMGGRRPGELSGGQQQRVALARALAPGASVILLDEPFSALDASLRQQVRDDVRSVLHATGVAAVLVTHDQQEALSFAERVAVMERGRIAQAAEPETIYRRPATLGVGTFVGDSTVIPATLIVEPTSDATGGGCRAESVLGTLAVDPSACAGEGRSVVDGARVILLVRPEQIELHQPDDAVASTGDPAMAEVRSTSYFGHDALARLETDSGQQVLARVNRFPLPEVGTRLAVSIREAVSAFPVGET